MFVRVLSMVIATFVPSQASTAYGGVKLSGKPHSLVMLGAQVNAGGVVSMNVSVWLQTFEFPHVSLALHVLITV